MDRIRITAHKGDKIRIEVGAEDLSGVSHIVKSLSQEAAQEERDKLTKCIASGNIKGLLREYGLSDKDDLQRLRDKLTKHLENA